LTKKLPLLLAFAKIHLVQNPNFEDYMKKLLLLTLLIISWSAVWSQDRAVTGKVTAADEGLPLPGVNVVIEGTTKGTTTDADGNYTVQLASTENTLVFSFVGYTPFTVTVDNRNVIDVALQPDVQALNEIVVVGYGTQREKDLTSAISTIKTAELAKTPSGQAMQALQGKVPGVQVVSSGAPGSAPTVRIRGIGSYPGSAEVGVNNAGPLYVVDGMFYDNIDFLNPADIQSMSILKDASAAAIYGVRAANGVVLIETRGGKIGQKAQVTYDGYYGVQVAQNILQMSNAEQFTTMANESGSAPDADHILQAMQRYGRSRVNPNVPNVNTDWYNEVLRPAAIQNHSLDVSGGGERTAYSIGTNYFFQEGILDMRNDFERFNLRSKIDYNATDWLTVGANFVLSNSVKYSPDQAVWNQSYFAVPILPVYDDQNTDAYPTQYADATDIGYRGGQNPFPTMDFNDNQLKSRNILTNFYLKFNLMENEKLTFKSAYNNGSTFFNTREVDLPFFLGDNFKTVQSALLKKTESYINQIWDNVLTYTDNIGDHNFTVMAGTSYRDEAYDMLQGKGLGFPTTSKESWYLDQATEILVDETKDDGRRYYGLSYFGRVSYNFADKYLIYGTMRADGSSKYQEKWGYFPSVGIGWVISEEDFLQDVDAISFLKLRGSWGRLGNDKIKASDGSSNTVVVDAAINDVLVSGTRTINTFSALAWEVNEEINVGLTAKFLDDRLSLDADYFTRDTENATILVTPPIGDAVLKNVGTIRNSGFELAMNWTDELSNGLQYFIGFNMGTLKNEVLDLYGQPYVDGGSAEFRQRSIVGEPMLAFFGWETDGVYQSEEQIQADPIAVANALVPGDFKYKDLNSDGIIDAKDRKVLGSYFPTLTYGASLGASYKNFEVSVNIMGQQGNKILNRKRGEIIWTPDGNMDADLSKNRWHGEGTSNKYPSSAGLRKGWNQKMSNYFVEDGSFFRIQNVQLAYNIRNSELFNGKMPDTRITLTADRPLTVFDYNGFNPEVADGIDSQTYPIPAVYTVGLNVRL
jgi:TonB-dependent starch-binding outer membrane protein SusC